MDPSEHQTEKQRPVLSSDSSFNRKFPIGQDGIRQLPLPSPKANPNPSNDALLQSPHHNQPGLLPTMRSSNVPAAESQDASLEVEDWRPRFLPARATTNSALREIWRNTDLSLKERTARLDERLHVTLSAAEYAAMWSEIVEADAGANLWPYTHIGNVGGDSADADGAWETREVIFLVRMWPDKHIPLKNKSIDMMGLSGNERSLSSMESKFRQITGKPQYIHDDLKREQVELDAHSPIRKGQNAKELGAGAWLRLEDNTLRRIHRSSPSVDWNKKSVEWQAITGRKRSPHELIGRWGILKVAHDPWIGNLPLKMNWDPSDDVVSPHEPESRSGSRNIWTHTEVDASSKLWPYGRQVSAPDLERSPEMTGSTRTMQRTANKWQTFQHTQQRNEHSIFEEARNLSPEFREKLISVFSRYRREMKSDEKQALIDELFAETQVAGSFEELLSLYASLTRPRGG